ncbi:AHH domain-containing protein [Myxococcus xanthus]|uniref:AHH domain-containing protein n=1 Tax=Myxococcus xanthus TaxID=34 RepID=UPI00112AFAD6
MYLPRRGTPRPPRQRRTVSVGFTEELPSFPLVPPRRLHTYRDTTGGSERHHIATNKNDVSALRGGPWTPRFRRLFARAGMELKDPENIVEIAGHKGPHPKQYHDIIFLRLQDALGECRTVVACRKALTMELRSLAAEAQTPGTTLHRLVTQGK